MTFKSFERFEIENLGTLIVSPDLPFNKGINWLRKNNAELICLRDLAFSRVHAKDNAKDYLHSNGTYVKESFILYQNAAILLPESVLLKNNEALNAAVWACSALDEYFVDKYIYDKICDQALEEDRTKKPEERSLFIARESYLNYSDKDENLFIPTEKLKDVEITNHAYRDMAEIYGNMLNSSGIKKLPVWFPETEYLLKIVNPVLRQGWTCCLKGHKGVKGDSGISANNKSLYEPSRLIGIIQG